MSATRTRRTRRAGSQRTYDAFISYSHAADSRLAPALERGLRRLTRAWYQRQALRIFRDQTTLAANPDLYATIELALQQSRNFVLLASPTAARSPWVRREVRYWKEHRERETFFIVLTDGVIRWNDTEGDFDWRATSALPDELRGWFPREPLWVHLGWTRGHDPSDLTLRHGRFRDDIATLAAALHGRSKDQIDSEDARQHRLAVRLGRVFVATLVMLLILAGVESNIANTQRNIDQRQTAVAQKQRALSTQQALEAEAEVDAATSPEASLKESLAALQANPTGQVRQTLVNTLLHTRFQGSSQPQTPDGLVDKAAFSADGHLFVDSYSKKGKTVVSLWRTTDPVHPVLLASLPGLSSAKTVTDVAFSADGRVLAVVADGKAELWSAAATPRLLSSFSLPQAQAMAFSPDGATLAVVGGQSANGALETWDIARPAAPRMLARVGGLWFPQDVAFSPDGRTLVTGSGEESINSSGIAVERTRAILWDVSVPQALRQLTTIWVWDGEGGIAFGSDGKTLALTWSNKVSLWSIADPAHPRQLAVLLGDTSEIDAIAFSPDGRSLVTGGLQQNKIVLWNTTNPAHVPHSTLLAQDAASISALTFVHGGQSVLAADQDTQVSQWRIADNAPTLAATLTDPADTSRHPVLAVAVSPDSHLLAMGDEDKAVVLWSITNPARPTKLSRIPSNAGNVSAVAFSPDGSVLAVGSWNQKLALWDIRDPASPRLLATASPPGVVSWLTFTPGGTMLAGGGDPRDSDSGMPDYFAPAWSDLWNVSDARHPVVLHRFSQVGNNDPGALSADGKTLILPAFFTGSLGASQVQVWNIADPAHPVKLPDPDTNPLASVPGTFSDLSDHLTFDPARGLAATVSAGESPKTVLWSYNGHGAASQLSAFTGPTDTVRALAFHPGGNLIAAASNDFTSTIGDVADTAQPFTVLTITGFEGWVNDTVFSPDGRLLVAGSNDGTVQIWTLGALPSVAANSVGLACQLTGGGFTRSQWAHAVGQPYASSCPS